MRKYDLQSATRIFIRFRSTFGNGGSNEKALSLTSKDPLNSPVSTRTAAYTSVPRSLLHTIIAVLAGPEAGGIPPFASVYPSSRQDRARVRTAHRCRNFDGLQESSPPSPQDLWTRALTLASKDVKSITSKMLVYFFQRGKASYRPWSPTMSKPNHSAASSNSSVAAPGSSDSDHPILDHPIRLTLSHYTTLIHGLLLRRHYPVALSWARNLIYPFPSPPTYTSSRLKDLSRKFNHLKYSRNSVHLYLDGPALSACLVVLARLGRVHEAIAVLEAYAAPSFLSSPARSARHADARHVQLNSVQMNDFLLTLLRWPSKKHALPVPSVDFPLPLKPTRSHSRSATLHKPTKKTRKALIGNSSLPTQATAATRSARPDLLLRLLPALYSRYGVAWDARTVCLMLQAVRMGAKMDSVSAFGLRKVISDLFGRNMKSNRKEMSSEGSSKIRLMMEETSKLNSVGRHNLLVENIMEVLWETVDAENTTSSSLSKPFRNKTDKKIKKNASPAHASRQSSSLSPLEYIPFRPWPVPVSFSPSPDASSSGLPAVASMFQSILPGPELGTYSRFTTPTHPFLLAREIFLRLIWEHAETLNRRESLDINLHAISSPAILPRPSLARLFDPDGDGLGHLGGLPKWFGVLEETLKRKLGFGLEVLKIPSTTSPSSLNTGDSEVMSTNLRMKLVDEVFGYPKNPRSPTLPKLTSIAFHHYILLLGLSAPEPREFIQAGWDQRYPFEGYPQPIASTYTRTYVNRSAFPLSSSTGPFTGCTTSNLKTAQQLISSLTLIPGVSEIPISLFYMRALRIVPTKDTLCAAVVFWREAVGGESLIELGVKEYKMSRMKLKDGKEEDNPSSSSREVEDAYAKEYEMWKASKEPPHSEFVELGEYAKFCRWIREWVDEINTGRGSMRDKTMMTMPHPYHIHRWAGIIRKMREGQGYDDDEKESKGFEGKEEDVDEDQEEVLDAPTIIISGEGVLNSHDCHESLPQTDMGKLSKIEDRPTPPEVYNWRVYMNAIIATFAAAMIGYDSAFIGTSITLASFKTEFSLTTKSTAELDIISANIVSMYQAGSFFGAIFGYPIGYFLGRKWGLFISAAIFVIGAILQTVANSSIGLGTIYAGRVIAGMAIGVASNLAPIYVAEIAPPAIRGRLIGLYELMWQIGGVVGFWINYGVSLHILAGHKQWLIAFAVQLIPGGLLLIGSLFLRESPRWLVSRDRNDDAVESLSYIRHLSPAHPYIVEEIASIDATIQHERSLAGAGFLGPARAVFASKALVLRLLLGSSMFVWQNATGINAINYYSPTIFKSIGVTGQNSGLLTTGVYGIIKLVGALIWLLYLVDQFGRRAVLIGGSAGGAVCMYYIAAYIAVAKPAEHPTTSLTSGGKSAIAFFYLWTVFYSPTWNGTPWVYTAEIFPQHVRVFSQACMAASNWLYAFLIARFTPQMFTAMGYGVYLFFASLMIVSIPFVFFYVPETKQVPLERMDDIFAPGLPSRRAHSAVMGSVEKEQHVYKGKEQGLKSSSRTSVTEKEEIEYTEVV